MHPVLLTLPSGHLKPDCGRQLQSKHHCTSRHLIHQLSSTFSVLHDRHPIQFLVDDCGVLWLLVKREQQGRCCQPLVLVIDEGLHGIVVNPNILVRVSGRDVEDNFGESRFCRQTCNRKFTDVEARAVGAETEPEDEGDDAYYEEKA